MKFTVKKVYDVWVVLDPEGNEIEECPSKKDAQKFADGFNEVNNPFFVPE
jgi:hypothetical protein